MQTRAHLPRGRAARLDEGGDAAGADGHSQHARAADDGGAVADGTFGEGTIEAAAIDDRRSNAIAFHLDAAAVAPVKPGGAHDGTDGLAGKIELVERLETEHARAVDGIADDVVFLEHQHGGAFTGEGGGRRQPGRPGADDHDIPLTIS